MNRRSTGLPNAPIGRGEGVRPAPRLLMTGLLFLLDCSARNGTAGHQTNAAATPPPPSLPAITATPTGETPSDLTLTGIVREASPSARIIVLEKPAEGISTIALIQETAPRSADGREVPCKGFCLGPKSGPQVSQAQPARCSPTGCPSCRQKRIQQKLSARRQRDTIGLPACLDLDGVTAIQSTETV